MMLSFVNGKSVRLDAVPTFSYEEFRNQLVCEDFEKSLKRVVALWKLPDGRIACVLGNPTTKQLEIMATSAEAYKPLADEVPALHRFEAELRGEENIRPFMPLKGEAAHEVAVGPVHAGVIEPGHFRFQCMGEDVHYLEIALGYQHRGAEKLIADAKNDARRFALAETIAGDSSVAASVAAHTALGYGPGDCELALELERIANHVGDLGALAGDVAYLPTASFCGRIRGEYLNMTAQLCGNRFGRGMWDNTFASSVAQSCEKSASAAAAQSGEKSVSADILQSGEKSASAAAAQSGEKSASAAAAQSCEKSASAAAAQSGEKSVSAAAAQSGEKSVSAAAAQSGEKSSSDCAAPSMAQLKEWFMRTGKELFHALDLLFSENSALERFEGTGRVDAKTARAIGLVGMAGRASGLAVDSRIDFPMEGEQTLVPLTSNDEMKGDVLARAAQRYSELLVSHARVRRILTKICANEKKIKDLSQNSQSNAQNSQLNAQNSQLNAQNSQSNAQNSQLNAQNSQLNAQNSQLNAQNSQSNAKDTLLNTLELSANFKIPKCNRQPNSLTVAVVEAWRGELVHIAVTGPSPDSEVKSLSAETSTISEVKSPAVGASTISEVKSPAVGPSPDSEVKSPAVGASTISEVKSPAVGPSPDSEVKSPAVGPSPDSEVKSPAVGSAPISEVKSPAVGPAPDSEVKSPAVGPSPDSEVKSPAEVVQYKVFDPSYHNWFGLAQALRGEQISNFPICNKSFNLSYCGVDR